MSANSSMFNVVDFSRYYTKKHRAVVINRGTRIQPPTGLSSGWPEVRILITAGLLVCAISLVINSWPF